MSNSADANLHNPNRWFMIQRSAHPHAWEAAGMGNRRMTARILALLVAAIVAVLTGCLQKSAAPQEVPTFPWPPPPASAEAVIPANWLPATGTPTQLSNVAERLEQALQAAKYRKWSYSSVPNGFALVTQMEQIKPDGTPSPDPARWSTDLPSVRELTLLEFIKALASAPPGYYRVIVFIVTDQPWSRSGDKPTGEEAQRWLAKGFNRLPASIGELPYGKDFRTTALVYEFKKRSESADASLVEDSETGAAEHLRKAGISDPLSGWR
jgi:hypothetical protein